MNKESFLCKYFICRDRAEGQHIVNLMMAHGWTMPSIERYSWDLMTTPPHDNIYYVYIFGHAGWDTHNIGYISFNIGEPKAYKIVDISRKNKIRRLLNNV